MPRMQTAVSLLNAGFGPDRIGQIGHEAFSWDSGLTLSEGFLESGIELDAETIEFVEGWPSGLLASVKALIFENLQREGTVPITFAWAPAYDYEVSLWDVRDTSSSHGGVTVLFRSRYPDDPHPMGSPTGG